MIKPLHTANARIIDLVDHNGDLTQQIEISSSDEIGLIVSGINKFIHHIHEIILHVSSASDSLKESVDNTQKSITESTQELNSLSTTLTEMKDSLEQSTISVEQMDRAAESMSTSITSIHDTIKEGTKLTKIPVPNIKKKPRKSSL